MSRDKLREEAHILLFASHVIFVYTDCTCHFTPEHQETSHPACIIF